MDYHAKSGSRVLLQGALYGAMATILAIAAALGVGLLVLRPFRVEVTQSPESPAPPQLPARPAPARPRPPEAPPATVPSAAPPAPALLPSEAPAPASTVLDPAAGTATTTESTPEPTTISTGRLRVSNQTLHPVRIALLPQSDAARFGEPVHWDFAPEEGSLDGLRLSLPSGQQTIQTGDVLVAFAQDGSQRYWGPYVVGDTPLPAWQPISEEWQLTIQTAPPG